MFKHLSAGFEDLDVRPLAEVVARSGSHDLVSVSIYSNANLTNWSYYEYDLPIILGLVRQIQPKRHLEFGTWEGRGTAGILGVTNATVWTINLPQGEARDDESWAYGTRVTAVTDRSVVGACSMQTGADPDGSPRIWHRTDAGPYIGRIYREQGLGGRVCQIYSDSRDWDTSNYQDEFFDTVLIDGGHTKDVVTSDTLNALRLIREGGLVIWHDFCPVRAVIDSCPSVRGVTNAIIEMLPEIKGNFRSLYWIEPSWILVGDQRLR